MPISEGSLLGKLFATHHSVYPASSSKFINHLASFLLCSGWWSTFCSIIVMSREASIATCKGKAIDTITTPSCELAFDAAVSKSAEDPKTCPTGCESEPFLYCVYMPAIDRSLIPRPCNTCRRLTDRTIIAGVFELEDDFVPLICLMCGVMLLVLIQLAIIASYIVYTCRRLIDLSL